MSGLYLGKISRAMEQQLEEAYYVAGEKGNPWYGGIDTGDYVLPVQKLRSRYNENI